ncbi:hypothetical protein DM02DRAFT_414092 [Periconia macrospinosa]|uniref:Apoptosis-inducing TAF9-like domain 1 family protein n=1 Tax=Periconia macrospinosa TaxID=97972 RepID=A0A2V1DP18_9PLEO|nr:hypothetical protein DM02DRAFT_414092 [Periconia macrospinosa]
MAPPTEEDLEREERLKSALWYSIGQFVDEQGVDSFNATPQFIGALTELVYTQIANSARDLETFSHHAGRKVVNTDDVMLLTRRNEALETMLRGELEGMRAREGRGGGAGDTAAGAVASAGGGGGKKRGRPPGKGKAKA